MDCYNCKLVKYPNGLFRMTYYQNGVISRGYDRKKKFVIQERNPFDGDMSVVVEDFPDSLDEKKKVEHSREVSRSRTIQKIYDYAHANTWEWFLTLTFDPSQVDRYNYDDCCRLLSLWLDRTRKYNPDMKYIIVPELHEDGAFHFHGLFSGISEEHFTYWKNGIFHVSNYGYGFTTATKVKDTLKAAGYIGKYITKELCAVSKFRKRYWASRNLMIGEVKTLVLQLGNQLEGFLDMLFNNCDYFKPLKMCFGMEGWFYEWKPSWHMDFDNFAVYVG